jgi:S1-C subfamily serine protease
MHTMKRLLSLIMLVSLQTAIFSQQREKVAKTDAVLVVEGTVKQLFRSPRQSRTDYIVQLDAAKVEVKKRPGSTARVTIPVPGDVVYVHVYQLNSGIQPVASLDSYGSLPAETARIRAYLSPREAGGWEGTFPDWYEVTGEATAGNSSSEAAPTPTRNLGLSCELIKIGNRSGLKVTSLERGGAGQKAGLELGDVIVAVNGTVITDANQLEAIARDKQTFTMHVIDVNSGRVAQVEMKLDTVASAPGKPAPGTQEPAPPVVPAGRKLGLGAEPITIGQRTAMRITRVDPDSPAAKAGLEVNDVIVDANGIAITGAEQLAIAVRKSGPTLTLTVRDSRTGKNTPVQVALDNGKTETPLPGGPLNMDTGTKQNTKLGAVTELTFFNVEAAVKITEVEPGSPAANAGLRVGTIILEANGKSVMHPNTLNEVVRTSGATLRLKVVEPGNNQPTVVSVSL